MTRIHNAPLEHLTTMLQNHIVDTLYYSKHSLNVHKNDRKDIKLMCSKRKPNEKKIVKILRNTPEVRKTLPGIKIHFSFYLRRPEQ